MFSPPANLRRRKESNIRGRDANFWRKLLRKHHFPPETGIVYGSGVPKVIKYDAFYEELHIVQGEPSPLGPLLS